MTNRNSECSALFAGAVLGAATLAAASSVSHCDDEYYYDDCHRRCDPVVQTQPRPVWMPDSASSVCTLPHCMKPLSIGNRHHCRACGALICSNCSRERLILRNLGYSQPQRVCDRCVAHFRKPLVVPVVQQQPLVYQAPHVVQNAYPAVQQFYAPPPQYQAQPPQYQAQPPQYQAPPAYTPSAQPPAYNARPQQQQHAQFEYAKPSAPPL